MYDFIKNISNYNNIEDKIDIDPLSIIYIKALF